MIKFIKKCVFFVIIVLLCLCFVGFGILTYIDSNSTKARNYLLENYEITSKDWKATKYTEYIYEDIADCNSLWLKKCTTDPTLQYEYVFTNKQKETITVKEDKEGNFKVEYNGLTPLKEKENQNDDATQNNDGITTPSNK